MDSINKPPLFQKEIIYTLFFFVLTQIALYIATNSRPASLPDHCLIQRLFSHHLPCFPLSFCQKNLFHYRFFFASYCATISLLAGSKLSRRIICLSFSDNHKQFSQDSYTCLLFSSISKVKLSQ